MQQVKSLGLRKPREQAAVRPRPWINHDYQYWPRVLPPLLRALEGPVNTVVLLTALDMEYQAVRRHLEVTRTRSHPAGTVFEVGHLPGTHGEVVIATMGEGNLGAAVMTERAIAMFQPRALLCVGIAGGLKDYIALGDVVVGTKIYAIHGGCDRDDGFLTRPMAWNGSHELEQFARQVAQAGTWKHLITQGQQRISASALQTPAVHFNPVASGEVVLAATDTSLTALLRTNYNDAGAVEMESAGIAQAAHLNRSLPVLSVRGISDQADGDKDIADAAGWRYVAAAHAAAFGMSIVAMVLGTAVTRTSHSHEVRGSSGRSRRGRACRANGSPSAAFG
jgi:nucleoside phosphorylase